MVMFHRLDGSGRNPRQSQVEALEWLKSKWHSSNNLIINAPTGTGKSLVARAIQLETNAAIINPNNILIKQNLEDYPEVNHLIGKVHFSCESSGNCDSHYKHTKNYCEGCPYQRNKQQALLGAPTLFNPYSYIMLKRFAKEYKPPQTIVIDEFHQCLSMFRSLSVLNLKRDEWAIPSNIYSEFELILWLGEKKKILVEKYDEALRVADHESVRTLGRQKMECERILFMFLNDISCAYADFLEDSIQIGYVFLPHWVQQHLRDSERKILLSATSFSSDIQEILGTDEYITLNLESPIDKHSRPIFYRPSSYNMAYEDDPVPEDIVTSIEEIVAKHPGLNTIVHVTYALQEKLRGKFTIPVIQHTKETKNEALEQFKRQGGVFIASGFSEGIDLKDDLCRLTIIPTLQYPNVKSGYVSKRMSVKSGHRWYVEQTIKTLCQQVGRSTRNENDWSYTYILDNRFSKLVNNNQWIIPTSFTESIVWSGF